MAGHTISGRVEVTGTGIQCSAADAERASDEQSETDPAVSHHSGPRLHQAEGDTTGNTGIAEMESTGFDWFPSGQ